MPTNSLNLESKRQATTDEADQRKKKPKVGIGTVIVKKRQANVYYKTLEKTRTGDISYMKSE